MSHLARDPTLVSPPVDVDRFLAVVRGAQAGNIAAFDTLFQRYNARICTYLARMVGNDEEGRDLAQETFIKVWRALPAMHDEAHFDTWLYRIATNTAIDHLRRRKARWPLWKEQDVENTPESICIAGPEEQVEEAEHIKSALVALSPQYRACLLLQHYVGLSQREIAKSMNLSEKSVSIYVSRGCAQFRKAYARLANGKEAKERKRSFK